NERIWYREWKHYKERYPEAAYEAKLLERIAWEIFGRAKKSSSEQVRQVGLIAAALTRDIRSVPMILQGLQDSNASIRALSVELCGLYGDAPLKKAFLTAYKIEKIRTVRASMIRCFGLLRMYEMREPLLASLEGGRLSTEEQQAVIEMIVYVTQGMQHDELAKLVTSKRSALRMLAAEVIAKCNLLHEGSLLHLLMQDSHPSVTACALKTLGLLRIENIEGQPITKMISPYLQSPLAPIAITASWLAKLHGDARGDKVLTYWIQEGDAETRVVAAGAICALGSYGVELALSLLKQ